MMKNIIYMATFPNGKSYVGQTKTELSVRMRNHKYRAITKGDDSIFCNAIRKYGFSSITWKVLVTCKTWEEMQIKEKQLVEKHKTISPGGYNAVAGGRHYRMTDEIRKKISISHMGISNGKHSEEHRKRISEGTRLAWQRVGVKEKFSRVRTGKKHKSYKYHD